MKKGALIVARMLYGLLLAMAIGIAINTRGLYLHPAIASYSAFESPNIKTDRHVPFQYRNRFFCKALMLDQIRHHPNNLHLRKIYNYYHRPYKTVPVHNLRDVSLKPNFPIWNTPWHPDTKFSSSTNRLADTNQLVKLCQKATNGRQTFYRIVSNGYVYGWVSAKALSQPNMYRLPFKYYSQMYPLKAPDACEAVSLRMALSVKGHNPRISMRKFINRIPRSKNPNKGYTASPYHYGDGASIYPKALAKYAHRYDRHAYPYTGLTRHQIIYDLEHGNPIVFEGSYRMHDTSSDHTLVLIGYSTKDHYLAFADPFYRKNSPYKPISWVSIHKFIRLFHQPLHGARAVVIK